MTNPFERFYDTVVMICAVKSGGGYSNRGDKKTTVLAEMMADVQAYSGGLAMQEYGLELTCQYRMFCNRNEYVIEGNYVNIGNRLCRIVHAVNKRLGMMAILQYVRNIEND